MIRTPPLFPRPSIAHRTLRQPPERETTSPASGYCIHFPDIPEGDLAMFMAASASLIIVL